MVCLKTSVIFISLLGASTQAFATVTVDGLVLNPGPNWKYAKDFFGLPHAFLGEKKLSHRPTLAIVPVGKQDINQMSRPEDVSIKLYELNRKIWVEENAGKVLEFLPYQKSKIAKSTLHRFGFTYELGDKTFTEFSYYFSCKSRLYHVKSLALKSDRDGFVELEKIVQTMRCDG